MPDTSSVDFTVGVLVTAPPYPVPEGSRDPSGTRTSSQSLDRPVPVLSDLRPNHLTCSGSSTPMSTNTKFS